MEALIFNTIDTLLLALTGIFLIIQALYYFCLYNQIHRHHRTLKREEIRFTQEQPPISVVIAAREESVNLKRNLTAILEQEYPQFEVIVVNDGNSDESDDYLKQLEDKYHNLYHSFVPDTSRYLSRKKLAITIGIKAAKYDWIVLTHADCQPASKQWLQLMARNFTSRTQVVLGYSGYERGNGWLHKKISFDNLFNSLRYLGFALAGKPYKAIGRNLAYHKDLFYQQKGFSAHLNLQYGDDDLFVNSVASRENTRVETDPNASVWMKPVEVSKNWREEKINYTYTSKLLKGSQRWLAGFETSSRLVFYASWLSAFVWGILQAHWLVAALALLCWLLRWGMQATIVNLAANDLGEPRRYYATLPVFDLLQPLQSLRWKLTCATRKRSEFMRK